MPTLRENYEYLQYHVHTMRVALNIFNQANNSINEARDAYERIDDLMLRDLASPMAIRRSINETVVLVEGLQQTALSGRVDSSGYMIYKGWIAQANELLITPESKNLVSFSENSKKPDDRQIRRMITTRPGEWDQEVTETQDSYEALVKAYESRARYQRIVKGEKDKFGVPYMRDEETDDGQGEEKVSV